MTAPTVADAVWAEWRLLLTPLPEDRRQHAREALIARASEVTDPSSLLALMRAVTHPERAS